MNHRLLRAAGIALATLLVACNRNTATAPNAAVPPAPAPAVVAAPAPPAAPAIPASTEMKVNTVESVMVTRSQAAPDSVSISATGTVLSAGWTNAHLVAVDDPNGDTTIETFSFVATSPAEPVANPMVQPIDAQLQVDALPTDVKAIRIVSSTNEVSATVGSP